MGFHLYQINELYSGADGFRQLIGLAAGGAGTAESLTIEGSGGNYTFTGGGGNYTSFTGGAGNDTFTGGSNNIAIDGGQGIDTAVYAGARDNFTIARTASGYTVTDDSGAEGTDTLANIERLQFADRKLALDLGANAGNSAKIIGAVFGTQYLQSREYVGTGLTLFDSGQTMEQVARLAVGTDLFRQLAGSASNTDFVNHVYRNVTGSLPGASDLNYYVNLLDTGVYTQASLAVLAAESAPNQTNIDLVGLARTGIEYA